MWDVRACTACLATDVRMYSMSVGGLLKAYKLLTSFQPEDMDGMPRRLCWECGALLHKYHVFRDRCRRAHSLLRRVYAEHDEVTLEAVKQIDRASEDANLCSPFSVTLVNIDIDIATIPTPEETTNKTLNTIDNADYFIEINKGDIELDIKTEIPEFDFVDDVCAPSDSEDDKPLRLPEREGKEKRKKRKRCGSKRLGTEDVKSECVEKESNLDATGYTEELMTKEEQLREIAMRQHSAAYKKGRFKCTLCFKSFIRRDRFDNHMQLHDPANGAYECDICRVRVTSAAALREHGKKNHAKRYTCVRCGHVSVNQNTAAVHARGHEAPGARARTVLGKLQATTEKLSQDEQMRAFAARELRDEYRLARHRCRQCFHVSGRREALERHKQKHDPAISGTEQCDICRLRFRTRQSVTCHKMKAHAKKYTCQLCSNVAYSLMEAKSHHDRHDPNYVDKIKKPKVKKEARDQTGELCTTMSIESLTQEEQTKHFLESRRGRSELAAVFTCGVCLKGHFDHNAFSNHLRKHEPVSGKFQCDICKYRYKTRSHIQRHIKYFHKNQYRCKICGELFHSRMAATKHHLWHKGKVYECPHCGLQSNILSSHLTHVRLKHPSEHVCGACGEAFVSQLGLQQHNRITHSAQSNLEPAGGAPGPYCAACDTQFASREAWTKHVMISPKHERERAGIVNGCRECGALCASGALLKAHRRAAHPPRFQRPRARGAAAHSPRPCVQCGETMASAREYWTHFRRAHPGEAYPHDVPLSYICEHCGKGFRCNATLAIHRNVHTGVRNYVCNICPKSFFNPVNLKNHLTSHSERRPFLCRICHKAFKFKTALERHMRTHTGVKPYACEVCGKAFSDSSSCKLHVRTVHLREPTPYVSRARLERRRRAEEAKV